MFRCASQVGHTAVWVLAQPHHLVGDSFTGLSRTGAHTKGVLLTGSGLDGQPSGGSDRYAAVNAAVAEGKCGAAAETCDPSTHCATCHADDYRCDATARPKCRQGGTCSSGYMGERGGQSDASCEKICEDAKGCTHYARSTTGWCMWYGGACNELIKTDKGYDLTPYTTCSLVAEELPFIAIVKDHDPSTPVVDPPAGRAHQDPRTSCESGRACRYERSRLDCFLAECNSAGKGKLRDEICNGVSCTTDAQASGGGSAEPCAPFLVAGSMTVHGHAKASLALSLSLSRSLSICPCLPSSVPCMNTASAQRKILRSIGRI